MHKDHAETHPLNNSSRYTGIGLVIFLLACAVIGTTLFVNSHAATPSSSIEAENGTIASPAARASDATASGGSYVKFGSPGVCGQVGGACTAAQIATHGTSANCWMIYAGSYYILTSYINQHPGGASVFNSTTCGHDITSYMNGGASTAGATHNHTLTAYNILATYKTGPVN